MPNHWESSWSQFFAKHRLQAILEDDRRNNGADSEMEELGRQCVEQVVPRLLGALEQNGNTIKPVLVHGDLSASSLLPLTVDGVEMQEQIEIQGSP
jgi:protein-ribulosamine 3-kinase